MFKWLAGLVIVGCVCLDCAPHPISAGSSSYSPPGGSADGYYFHPCSGVASSDPAMHALAAMVAALEERGWTIEHVDVPRKQVSANGALRGRQEHTAGLVFTVVARGIVIGSARYAPAELQDDMDRWIGFLEPVYSKHSCTSDAALEARTKHYGITF